MLFPDSILAFGVAAMITAFALLFLRWRYPGRNDLGAAMLFLFSILFMTVWAGGTWMGSGSLVIFLAIGVGVLLLIMTLTSPRHPRGSQRRDVIEVSGQSSLFGVFFWVLMLSLLLATIARYIL